MNGELGHLLLIVAWVAAGVQALAGLWPGAQASAAAAAGRIRLQAMALGWQAIGVLGAFGLLAAAFVGHDFSLVYVVQHSHVQLPWAYRVAAVWGGHEGSMLLWTLMLTGWSVAAAWALRPAADLPAAEHAARALWRLRVLAVLGGVALAMLAFVLFTSNPFVRLLPAALEGRSLNPLLQDPGLVLHPPLLYLGYVGTAVPFAMAVATLAWGAPADWPSRSRPFVAWAMAALSAGIALGSWWAYYELGWGGWWFWDPVENASLMPWLAQAALLHTLAVRERRGGLPHWTGVLALGGFVLALLGTFLVRSGVLTSVHAFAADPRRGSFMLALIAAALLLSLGLWGRHAARLQPARQGAAAGWLSRDTALLGVNLGLAVACGSVLLGTLYPLAMDALGLGKLSVGAPYFDVVMAPLLLALALLLVPAPWLGWGATAPALLRRRLRPTAWALAAAALALPAALLATQGRVQALTLLALWLAVGVAAGTLDWMRQRRAARRGQPFGRGPAGMVVAHLGVAVFTVGVAMVKGYGVERDASLAPGQSVPLADCRLQLDRLGSEPGPNWQAVVGQFTLACPGEAPRPLRSEKRVYVGSAMPMSESAIDAGFTRDLYVALGEPLTAPRRPGEAAPAFDPQVAWSVRVQVKPFIRWVWAGVLLMALGCVVAAPGLARRRPVAAGEGVQPALNSLS
ncbi:heme lyase CcmF/NrfE family subunit [Ideonella livida]|uniref:Heme lyase CcmF/NrfE family subunit n=1 Tax=Ideonella livida TaxID=2707176 RepID=A0A7C9TIQ9_9BURK|nr:heme lyase CcmF/NrfE family subunit [Ideonella livida]NDY91481.1 heme lyase CcmF/NrfE family subunit [Ideonella livida]